MSAPPRRAPDDLLVRLRHARDVADVHHNEPLDVGALAADGADRGAGLLGIGRRLTRSREVAARRPRPQP